MKNKEVRRIILLLAAAGLVLVFTLIHNRQNTVLHSTVSYAKDSATDVTESVIDTNVPLIAPRSEESDMKQITILSTMQPITPWTNTGYSCEVPTNNDPSK